MGKTNQTSMAYQEEPGDEVEDLMELLQRVKVYVEWDYRNEALVIIYIG